MTRSTGKNVFATDGSVFAADRVIVGNDSACGALPELLDTLREYEHSRFLGSHTVIKVMNSTASMNLGPLLGARGINLSVSAACSSGAHAVGPPS